MTYLFLGAAAVLLLVSNSKTIKGIFTTAPNNSEPPEYEKIRLQMRSDYDWYKKSVIAQLDSSKQCGEVRFTGDSFCGNPTSITKPSNTEIQKLSNAVEWASKCQRTNGVCLDKTIIKGISDDAIIETVKNITAAVIYYRYPNATPDEQADIYIRTVKETVIDVRNLHWVKILPYITIIIAAITAGVALAGAPAVVGSTGAISGGTGWAGTGTIIGTLGSTVGTTIPAGLTIAGGVSQLAGGAPKSEREAKKQLAITFAILKEVKP